MKEEDNINVYNQSYYNVKNSFYDNWNNNYQQIEKKPIVKKIIIPVIVIVFLISSFR